MPPSDDETDPPAADGTGRAPGDVGEAADAAFGRAVGRLGPALLGALDAMELVWRRLHPPRIEALRRSVAPLIDRLGDATEALRAQDPPGGLADFAARLAEAAGCAERSGRLFLGEIEAVAPGPMAVLEAMRMHARAQAALFPLRGALPPVDAWFVAPGATGRLPALARGAAGDERVGLFDASNAPDRRGGFTLYVPEDYSADRAWPIVVALHGGFGHGADFLWSWLREARTHGWLLLAPTSRDTTWSLHAPDHDGRALDAMLEFVSARWRVDERRVLLAGLSDGATFALLHGLRADSPFTHLAPVAGVLHPLAEQPDRLVHARGRRIRLVHGALDWMFPVETARAAAGTLARAGAALAFDEVEDLSHTWPRERGADLLAWVDATAADAGDGNGAGAGGAKGAGGEARAKGDAGANGEAESEPKDEPAPGRSAPR